mmetsp:Transcript_84057/g.261428  ORF Transcript_84057/g.261428 Transcript_84057/m.261428 type:complete len:203 (-) Transcript_84057:716-1324(-)
MAWRGKSQRPARQWRHSSSPRWSRLASSATGRVASTRVAGEQTGACMRQATTWRCSSARSRRKKTATPERQRITTMPPCSTVCSRRTSGSSPPRARRKSSLSNASWARSGSRCRSVWCARNKTTMVSNRLRAQKVVQTSRNRSTHSSSPQTGTNVDTVSCETSFARMSVMPKERRSPTAWDMKKTPIDRKVKRMEGPMMSTV